MVTVLFRTLVIYLILSVVVRLMGKRQIGELEVSDLVTTLLVSEIASLPVTNPEIPIFYALVPIVTLLVLEVAASFLLIKFPVLKKLFSAQPTILLRRGKLQPQALSDNRISCEEMMEEIRQQGYYDLSEIDEAILESNGKLTIVPKSDNASPTLGDLGLKVPQAKLSHVVWNSGKPNLAGLALIGKSEKWLVEELKKKGYDAARLFCVTANADGKLFIVEERKKG